MMKTRCGMRYKRGDIVLVRFPFTNLTQSKRRPVLVIKDESDFHDIVCLQITSNGRQSNLLEITHSDFAYDHLPITSFVKYDKCFTLSSEIIDKKLTSLKPKMLEKLKMLFCDGILQDS